MLKYIILGSSLLCSADIFANVQICNNRDHKIYSSVAYAYSYVKDSRKMVVDLSSGWWGIDPGNCAQVAGIDGKKLLDQKIYIRTIWVDTAEMKNPRYLICVNPSLEFDYEVRRAFTPEVELARVPPPCDASVCRHPVLGDCSKVDLSGDTEDTVEDFFEEFPITNTNETISLD